MKKKIVGLLLLLMFQLSVTAFASYQPDPTYWKFIGGNDEVRFYFSPKSVNGTYEHDGVGVNFLEVYSPKGLTKWVPEKVRKVAEFQKSQVAYKHCRVSFGLNGQYHNIPWYNYSLADYCSENGGIFGSTGGCGEIMKGTWLEEIANAAIKESRSK